MTKRRIDAMLKKYGLSLLLLLAFVSVAEAQDDGFRYTEA